MKKTKREIIMSFNHLKHDIEADKIKNKAEMNARLTEG